MAPMAAIATTLSDLDGYFSSFKSFCRKIYHVRVSQDVFIHKPDVYVAYNFIHRIKNESNRPTNVVGGNVCRRNVRCAECDSIW